MEIINPEDKMQTRIPPINSFKTFSNDYKAVLNSMEDPNNNTFVIGKGGSGKTYLINAFIRRRPHETIVVAPTGLAASVLEEGLTIHKSFFFNIGIATGGMVHATNQSDPLIQKAKYLIIDEISMVRTDLFTAINQRLQEVRQNSLPFGGIKVILVGDPYQLEPVTDEDEMAMLQFYLRTTSKSHYFFQSTAFKNEAFQASLRIFSLEHSYRQQTDPEFLAILDNIRIGKYLPSDLEILNKRYSLTEGIDWPTITATRRTAKSINTVARGMMEGTEHTHRPEVRYNLRYTSKHANVEKNPAFDPVVIKLGEHVVLTRNDRGGLFVNGSIGIIETLELDPKSNTLRVSVKLRNGMTVPIHAMEFSVLQPYLDEKLGRIHHRNLATIINLPILSSTAMTIHKAQGQTLEKVTVNLGFGAFAHGQLYVALSRVQKLEDLVLATKIKESDIKTSPLVIDFMASIKDRIFYAY